MTAATPPRPARKTAVRRAGRPARAADPAAARAHLLDTATLLFARDGVASTTLAGIARHAGVTPAMLHYYFSNRDALLDTLVAERLVPLIQHVWTTPDTAPAPDAAPDEAANDAAGAARAAARAAALARITGLVGRLMGAVAERPWLPPLWIREVINEGGHLRERVLAHLPRTHLHEFAALIEQGRAVGLIAPGVEPRLVFISILGLTMLPLATAPVWRQIWQGDADHLDQAAIARHAVALLTGGLFGAAPAPAPAPRRRKGTSS